MKLKLFMLFILTLLLSGCVTATYKHGDETFRVTSLFKSVDGLKAEREGFSLGVDKTNSETQQMFQMMQLFDMMLKSYMSVPR